MRKVLIAAVSFAALAGAAGFALAQQQGAQDRPSGLFQADSNNDGTVTRSEYDASQTARFATLDANDDGQLTREERRAGRGERGEHGGRGHHRRGGHGMHHLARADADNDGNITRDEFLARPTQMFARLDDNSDGVISAGERPQRGEGRDGEGRRHMDVNDDGQISQSEFAAMGASRFERLDANNDGRVTREEADAARGHRHGR
jgi:Ca2+-binding EF-hand superfamily protein